MFWTKLLKKFLSKKEIIDEILTWEDLIKKAKSLGYKYNDLGEDSYLIKDKYMFYKFGNIYNLFNGSFIVKNRTPEQMYQIMVAINR